MWVPASRYAEALAAVAAVAWATTALLPVLGLASSALLFLLPVLLAAARGGIGPGLAAALAGAAAYNYFLLPPRFTFRIHGLDNLISVAVLVAVALVTSRLATRLMAREAEALHRARLSEEAAELSGVLSSNPAATALERGVALLAQRYGAVQLLDAAGPPEGVGGFSSLDAAAAAWAIHNGDITGHGTEVMRAADWTFVPLAPANRPAGAVAAIARPADGATRSPAELEHLAQLAALLGQARDRDALEAERRARELLAESDRMRRTLLASLAHDFRTPLTVITGRLALLAARDADAGDALAAAQRLDRTMNDLLAAARLEAGSLTPAIEAVDLVDAVEAALAAVPAPAGVTVRRGVPPDLPFAAADPVLLHHVLVNLIDNGLRHARGEVRIEARRDGGDIVLGIEDDGPGVPAAERARVFERFARGEAGDRRQRSGLGLAIVKGFADAMRMAIALDAAPSGGARFALRMRASAAAAG